MSAVPLSLMDTPVYPFVVQQTLAPIFAGMVTSTLLFGIYIDMVYNYFLRYGHTSNRFEHGLVIGCTLFMILIAVAQINYAGVMMVSHFGEPFAAFNIINDPYVISQAGNAVINAICQSFFAQRAWRLHNKSMALLVVFVILILTGFGAGLGTAIRLALGMSDGLNATQVVEHVRVVADMNFITSAIIDILLTSLIAWKLFTVKKAAGRFNEQTDHILHRLISMTLSTAALTTCIAIALGGLILSTGVPSYSAMALSMILPRCYGISMLFTMLLRNDLAADRDDLTSGSGNRFALGPTSGRAQTHKSSFRTPGGVLVALETVQHVDDSRSEAYDAKHVEAGYGNMAASGRAELE